MGKFLPIIDSIDSAIKSCTTDDDGNVTDGLVLVHKKISEVLTSMDIEEIPAEAEEFDPNLHHAIMHMEDETYEENIVVEVFQKGYKCKDKIIRPSMVKVAN
jgi:molecular chaperone GrpE